MRLIVVEIPPRTCCNFWHTHGRMFLFHSPVNETEYDMIKSRLIIRIKHCMIALISFHLFWNHIELCLVKNQKQNEQHDHAFLKETEIYSEK